MVDDDFTIEEFAEKVGKMATEAVLEKHKKKLIREAVFRRLYKRPSLLKAKVQNFVLHLPDGLQNIEPSTGTGDASAS